MTLSTCETVSDVSLTSDPLTVLKNSIFGKGVPVADTTRCSPVPDVKVTFCSFVINIAFLPSEADLLS